MADLNKKNSIIGLIFITLVFLNFGCKRDEPDKFEIASIGIDFYDIIIHENEKNELDTMLNFELNRLNQYCLMVLYFDIRFVETNEDLYCPFRGCRGRNDSITSLKWKNEEFKYNDLTDKQEIENVEKLRGYLFQKYKSGMTTTFLEDSKFRIKLDMIEMIYNIKEDTLIQNLFTDTDQTIFASIIYKKELLEYKEKNGMPEVVLETQLTSSK